MKQPSVAIAIIFDVGRCGVVNQVERPIVSCDRAPLKSTAERSTK